MRKRCFHLKSTQREGILILDVSKRREHNAVRWGDALLALLVLSKWSKGSNAQGDGNVPCALLEKKFMMRELCPPPSRRVQIELGSPTRRRKGIFDAMTKAEPVYRAEIKIALQSNQLRDNKTRVTRNEPLPSPCRRSFPLLRPAWGVFTVFRWWLRLFWARPERRRRGIWDAVGEWWLT